MELPTDFGLGPVRTLAHVAEAAPAPHHQAFWRAWREALFGCEPKLRRADTGDSDDPGATHVFESFGGTRIGCRLAPPPEGVQCRAMLVALHGYQAPPLSQDVGAWADLTARGVAVLGMRVRGFQGSRLDVPDLAAAANSKWGWVSCGLEQPVARAPDALRWTVAQAAMDVAHAVRAARSELTRRAGPEALLYVAGESLGGGLAVLALAGLARRVWVERLVLGLPSLGDWAWRARHGRWGGGAGAQLGAYLRDHGAREQDLYETIRLCDAALLAPQVSCAVLGKLAERDEVVPAPAAAAVFNALGAEPGRKYRFVVPFGHADAGPANARRHALFRRCVTDFLDPSRRPRDSMRAWSGLLGAGEAQDETGEQGELFATDGTPDSAARDGVLVAAYERAGRTLDDLPYTPEFTTLLEAVAPVGFTEREAFHRLHNLRKAGRLPRLGRAASSPPKLGPGEEQLIRGLVAEAVGTLGQRDQLPFTPAFQGVVERFNAQTGRALSPHDVWRVVAKLAK